MNQVSCQQRCQLGAAGADLWRHFRLGGPRLAPRNDSIALRLLEDSLLEQPCIDTHRHLIKQN